MLGIVGGEDGIVEGVPIVNGVDGIMGVLGVCEGEDEGVVVSVSVEKKVVVLVVETLVVKGVVGIDLVMIVVLFKVIGVDDKDG